MEGEAEVVAVVTAEMRVRGVSLTIGGMLLWVDLVSVACIGVMKLDCGWGWTPGRVWDRDGEDLLWGVRGRRGDWKVLEIMCEGDVRVCGRD